MRTSQSVKSHSTRSEKRHSPRVVVLGSMLMLASSLLGQSAGTRDISVTAVEGESWIRHLNRSFNETSMGKTWDLGPAPSEPGEFVPAWQLQLSQEYKAQVITLHGADLYRLSCRGCHGESGRGVPPEINSIIGPVQATSVAATLQLLKKAGRDVSPSDVAALSRDSKTQLLQRLHNGGENMPRPILNEAEIRALIPYLEQLSAVPGAERNQIAINESPYRVGEHIVKSTCHVCHGATGPNPDPQQILDGAIPPLSTLTTRVGLSEFVRKVTCGAPVIMGTPATPYRGRMPVFTYLSQDEAAQAYMYLLLYPPRD
jgi:mono/diheme cytochrome c family protein